MQDVVLKSARGLLAMLGVKGLGPVTAMKLASRFGTLGEASAAGYEGMKGLATDPVRRLIADGGQELAEAVAKADDELGRAADIGATVLSAFDEGYPRRLRECPDMPLVLYASGDLSLLERSVACVGTREPTRFGATVSERLATVLGEAGWTIVSGLARGVDAICHEAALACGAPTAAVLGSGMDVYSSDAAFSLASRIVEAGGIIITEQPLGREADPASLIRRNRIVTGVSAATFFMQGMMESGTMHSVRYALLQGRPVYAPGVPAAYADELLNHAAMCMARMDPLQFGQAIEAKPAVMDAIRKLNRPRIAIEIAGKDSYPEILAGLEGLVETAPVSLAL